MQNLLDLIPDIYVHRFLIEGLCPPPILIIFLFFREWNMNSEFLWRWQYTFLLLLHFFGVHRGTAPYDDIKTASMFPLMYNHMIWFHKHYFQCSDHFLHSFHVQFLVNVWKKSFKCLRVFGFSDFRIFGLFYLSLT